MKKPDKIYTTVFKTLNIQSYRTVNLEQGESYDCPHLLSQRAPFCEGETQWNPVDSQLRRWS
jgi:hypothetical protein